MDETCERRRIPSRPAGERLRETETLFELDVRFWPIAAIGPCFSAITWPPLCFSLCALVARELLQGLGVNFSDIDLLACLPAPSDEDKHQRILAGLADVDAGRTIPHEEVRAWAQSLFGRLTSAK
jgi:hypothetical protein